ncbi:MAG: pyruvate, phosphate dikinase [Nevskiaceae bacterium]|nr:MAG: pyruvate, phosphate dikinase [Nevskiaceae bacterium]TBR73628.1 MAG: pyruvate, phosphate dikinase [Nevskiaceae bacterium]
MSHWTLHLGEGPLPDRALIGGKAWSIARMSELGLPVPPAFVITTHACNAYQTGSAFPPGLEEEVAAGITWLEAKTGRTFGYGPAPLLVSVRSGAAISMPGMMDTVLNTGITPATEAALAAETGAAAFAHDVHRRYFELYAHIVLKASGVEFAADGMPESWNAALLAASGKQVPTDARACLHAAIRAVFESWNSRRARRYRQHNGIADDLGTAVTVQAMVFGNLSATSGTGVLFSRNPLTGEDTPYGEYLPQAQGEDVVSGRFTPRPLDAMRQIVPDALQRLLQAAATLEQANHDMQDIEFTVQNSELFILQSRAAKRAPAAALRCAIEMAGDGLIDADTVLRRITPEQLHNVLAPRLSDAQAATATPVAHGEPACPGVGIGTVVIDPDEAERRAANGEAVVLVRATTSPEDVHGMLRARAVVTEQGGATSHAAVVSRALGVACVTGCGLGTVTALAGQTVTVDATRGRIFRGALEVTVPDTASDPRLAALQEMIAAHAPLRVIPAPGDAGTDCVDLDVLPGGDDPANVARLLGGTRVAAGRVLATDAGMRAALAAGVTTVIGTPVLPLLLRAARAALPPAAAN